MCTNFVFTKDHTALSRELHVCKERVRECEEEIKDLIAERNNTKVSNYKQHVFKKKKIVMKL